MTETRVFEEFERSMKERDLASEIKNCSKQELAPLFLELFREHQPVLEGGCGSGKWMHFLKQNGISSVGLDWSQTLQAISREFDPTVQFDTGDLRKLPYADESFGAVMALGSIEHVIEGPREILREFHRVLRLGGVGLITVPYYSPLNRVTFGIFGEMTRRFKRINSIRRIARKAPVERNNPISYGQLLKERFRHDIYLEVDFDGFFYEYQFKTEQLNEELRNAGFTVKRVFPIWGDFGLFMKFGRLVGHYDRRADELRLTPLGGILSQLLPASAGGHMLCAIVYK